jgi:hypothetical protein
VFVAEDHPIARMGLCESLKNAKNILLVGSVSPFLQKMGNPVSFFAKVSKYSRNLHFWDAECGQQHKPFKNWLSPLAMGKMFQYV